jgi:hypothetical protein
LTVRLVNSGKIELSGTCPSEDAEVLFQYLVANRSSEVDWSRCEQAHTAVIQVLLASGCRLTGKPSGGFLNEYLEPAFRRTKG